VAKLSRLTHRIVIQLHLVAESHTIYSSYSRWPFWKRLDTPLYITKVTALSLGYKPSYLLKVVSKTIT